jgi:hypothetical protein
LFLAQCQTTCDQATLSVACEYKDNTCLCQSNHDHIDVFKCSDCHGNICGEHGQYSCECSNGAFCDNNGCKCNSNSLLSESESCSCAPEFQGLNCEQKIGFKCRDNFDCNSHACDSRTGKCNCGEGFSGVKCKIDICDCIYGQGVCNVGTKKCTCFPGYYGLSCEYQCPLGTWGQDCKNKCNCGNSNLCNPKNGTCYNENLRLNGKISSISKLFLMNIFQLLKIVLQNNMEGTVNGSVTLSQIVMLKEIIVKVICMEVNVIVLMAFMGRYVNESVIVTDILVMLKQENVNAKLDFLVRIVKQTNAQSGSMDKIVIIFVSVKIIILVIQVETAIVWASKETNAEKIVRLELMDTNANLNVIVKLKIMII